MRPQRRRHRNRRRVRALVRPLVRLPLDAGLRPVLDAVVDAEQVVVEPPVQQVDPVGAPVVERVDVPGLRQPDLLLHVQPGPPLSEVDGLDVEVVDAVGQQHAGAHVPRVRYVVPLPPTAARSRRSPSRPAGGAGSAPSSPVRCCALRRSAPARRVEAEGRAVGAVVVVPGTDRRNRHDGLQPGDAGRRDAVGDRAVVGLADHPDVPGAPARGHGAAAGLRGVAGRAAVQPVDDLAPNRRPKRRRRPRSRPSGSSRPGRRAPRRSRAARSSCRRTAGTSPVSRRCRRTSARSRCRARSTSSTGWRP